MQDNTKCTVQIIIKTISYRACACGRYNKYSDWLNHKAIVLLFSSNANELIMALPKNKQNKKPYMYNTQLINNL